MTQDKYAQPSYARHVQHQSPQLIRGKADCITAGGVIHGWAYHAHLPDACHVQVKYAGEVVAEAVARLFRRDMLRSGYGHGHHGFNARLTRPLPPGPTDIVLSLPAYEGSVPAALDVPDLDSPLMERVEDMLQRSPGWTVGDVSAHPACLHLTANHARLGHARFTDAVFRFVFGRWPSKAEGRMNVDSLAAGRITPTELLLECLASRERADRPPGLPGPFDADFPFSLAASQPSSPLSTSLGATP